MVEELVKLILEEGIKAAFSGAFHEARSRKARAVKAAAWISAAGSLVLFLTAATLAQGNASTPLFVGGVAGIVSFMGFGVRAAYLNAKAENDSKPHLVE